MRRLLKEIHPGEILLEEFMKPKGVSARRLASEIFVPLGRISGALHGRRSISADTAVRLGLFFGMEPRFWLDLQLEYDLRMALRALKTARGPRIRVLPSDAPNTATSAARLK